VNLVNLSVSQVSKFCIKSLLNNQVIHRDFISLMFQQQINNINGKKTAQKSERFLTYITILILLKHPLLEYSLTEIQLSRLVKLFKKGALIYL
jgi:hypothetical protein